MSSIDSANLAMAVESMRREADLLLQKNKPFTFTIAYDGGHLTTSLKEEPLLQTHTWVAVELKKENTDDRS